MEFELLDEPVLIIRSVLSPELKESQEETLKKIEFLLEDEIHQVREQIGDSKVNLLENYLIPFSLHLQTDAEIHSVMLESEWREAEGQELTPDQPEEGEEDSSQDYQVSDLMRVVKITYRGRSDRLKIFAWLSQQKETFPLVHGFGSIDFLLLPAKKIFHCLNSLKSYSEVT